MREKIYIIEAKRTAIGNFGGALKDFSATSLGSILIRGIIGESRYSNIDIDGVIIGNVLQAGTGQNPARQCSIGAGLSIEVPCLTVNKVCGSSMKAVDIAFRQIVAGYGQVYIAGGIESMSNSPYIAKNARWGNKLGHSVLIDELITDGLWCPYNDRHMGEMVEDMAIKYGVSRHEQDAFSLQSNQRAIEAIRSGRFMQEIIPVEIISRKERLSFETDERPREDSSMEKLSNLKPVFKNEGSITAGNSSGINDGAAMTLIASGSAVKKYGLEPLAEIVSISEVGVEPHDFGIAPVKAIRKCLDETGLDLDQTELVELNEAFAAQSISVLKELDLSPDKVNVNGGAIALGHPIGASGARIIVTLLHEMIKRKNDLGIASLCIGSGEGMAIVIRRV